MEKQLYEEKEQEEKNYCAECGEEIKWYEQVFSFIDTELNMTVDICTICYYEGLYS